MRILILLLTSTFFMGCTGYQYIASPSYVPFNTKKGDLKANLSYNHAQLGYSFSKHLSVFATGYKREGGTYFNFEKWNMREGTGANSYKDHSHEINLGMSYFFNVSNFTCELHLGGGGGKVYYKREKDFYVGYFSEFNADKRNIFIQPSFSYTFRSAKLNNILQLGFFTKVIRDQFYNINANAKLYNPYGREPDTGDVYFMNHNYRNLYFVEPGFCVRVGGRYLKGNAIISLPYNLEGDNIRYRPINLYLSAFFNLNLLKKK